MEKNNLTPSSMQAITTKSPPLILQLDSKQKADTVLHISGCKPFQLHRPAAVVVAAVAGEQLEGIFRAQPRFRTCTNEALCSHVLLVHPGSQSAVDQYQSAAWELGTPAVQNCQRNIKKSIRLWLSECFSMPPFAFIVLCNSQKRAFKQR